MEGRLRSGWGSMRLMWDDETTITVLKYLIRNEGSWLASKGAEVRDFAKECAKGAEVFSCEEGTYKRPA